MLESRQILLIVSGGIAAYKAAHLVRQFRKAGAAVRVVMTASAEEFVRPMTFQVLSENRVGSGLFEPGFEYEIGHIELARWPDLIVVAPATANIMAKARYGLADDLATTVLLATTAPVLFCPAMNTQMLEHPATQENLAALAARPHHYVLSPDSGELACKEVGAGRLPDADVIEAEARRVLTGRTSRSDVTSGISERAVGQPLAGSRVLVTAGPTREYFDPVRFISNPSTGRMGYAIAAHCATLGADVTLISGPTELDAPRGVRRVSVVTAEQMKVAVFSEPFDIAYMAAAVADYRPATQLEQKRKKSEGTWAPEFERTPDICAELSASDQRPGVLIGFAAETENVEDNARRKLERKRLDGIVANSVVGSRGAFGSDTNAVSLVDASGGIVRVERAPKHEIAKRIVAWTVETLLDAGDPR